MSVTSVWVGAVSSTGATVRTKVVGSSVRVLVSTSPDLTSPVGFGPVAPTAEGTATVPLSGLDADTQYHYVVEVDGERDSNYPGAVRTFPPSGSQASFSFAAAGDSGFSPQYPGVGAVLASDRISNHIAHDTIREHSADPLFFCHLGDLTYYDLGSDNHGITGGASLDNYRRQLDDVLLQPRQHQLYRERPLVYVWDDHCYGPNNSDGTHSGKDNVAQAYAEKVPSYNLPDGDGAIYHSFQIGRVLFIVWDCRFYRSPNSDPDGPDKTMLGSAQKDWMRTLLETSTAEALVVFSSVHWIPSKGDDEWADIFETERQEVGAMFTDLGWADRMILVCADSHWIGMDSGANNTAGGFPTYGFAGIDVPPQDRGDPQFDQGVIKNRHQYGIVAVTDTGDSITLQAEGYHETTVVADHTLVIDLGTDDPETTPNVPATPGEQAARVTWLGCNLITGDIIAELPEIRGRVKRVIGAYTSASLTMPIPLGGPGSLPTNVWKQATAFGQTMIVPVVNDVPAAAFIPLEDEGGTDAELQLGCVSLEGYLEHRFVGDHLWTDRDEASVIAAGLVADAQVEGIDLVVDAPPTGTLRDREYFDVDDGTVYERLVELSEINNGIEWTIDVDWFSEERRSISKIIRIRKRIGLTSANPPAVFSTEGAADATYQYKRSYAEGRGANHIVATSSGQGEDRPQSPAVSDVLPGWPRYERRFSPSSSIKNIDVLTDHAVAELNRLRDGARTWDVTARWDAWPRLGIDWRLGDDIGLELTGHRHPFGVTVVRRAIGWELDMQAGTVTPIFLET